MLGRSIHQPKLVAYFIGLLIELLAHATPKALLRLFRLSPQSSSASRFTGGAAGFLQEEMTAALYRQQRRSSKPACERLILRRLIG
jgi:hypothetical protein